MQIKNADEYNKNNDLRLGFERNRIITISNL